MRLADHAATLRARTSTIASASDPASDAIDRFVAARAAGLDASLWLQPDRGIAIVGRWSQPSGA